MSPPALDALGRRLDDALASRDLARSLGLDAKARRLGHLARLIDLQLLTEERAVLYGQRSRLAGLTS